VEITQQSDAQALWTTDARRGYQERQFPVTAARPATWINDLRIGHSLSGTNGVPIVSPVWGRFKGFPTISSRLAREDVPMLPWAGVLFLAAAATTSVLVRADYKLPPWWALIGLALVAATAERFSIEVAGHIETSVSFLPLIFTAVAFGPLGALVVAGLSNVSIFGRPYLRWSVYTPARALTGAASGLVGAFVVAEGRATFGSILVATLAAALTNVAVDSFFNLATLVFRGTASARVFVRSVGPLLLISLPLYVPMVALLVYGYRQYSLWVVGLFLLSALALQRLVQLYHEQREATRSFAEANRRLERANLSFATALVATLDARDEYTAGHSAAVAIYARDIATRLGLEEKQQRLAHLCGLVHDIGKVGLPAGLLEKPGPLTLEERRRMEQHSAIGERILTNVEDYAEIAAIVRHHHERVDGNGYPDRLSAEEIPLLSRIIAVADAYNAMTSDRPYRDAMPSRVARLRLAQAVETQFDTTVVAAFEAVLAGETEGYRTGRDTQFTLRTQEAVAGDYRERGAA
jgi:putative nucleotidyltransferase with HDIG domain